MPLATDKAKGLTAEQKQTFIKATLLGRLGAPEDIAEALVF